MPMGLEGQEGTMMPPPHFPPGFLAAVANQQLAMITSQGIPFMPHGMPGLYTSPSGGLYSFNKIRIPHPYKYLKKHLLARYDYLIVTNI